MIPIYHVHSELRMLRVCPLPYHVQNGESALHAAALFGHAKVVKELAQAGADPQLKNKVMFTHWRRTSPLVMQMSYLMLN